MFLDRLKKRGMDADEFGSEVKEDLEPLQKPFAGLETALTQAAYFKEVFHSVIRLHKIDKVGSIIDKKLMANRCTLSVTVLRTVFVISTRKTAALFGHKCILVHKTNKINDFLISNSEKLTFWVGMTYANVGRGLGRLFCAA